MKRLLILFCIMGLSGCGSCCRVSSSYDIDFSVASKPIKAEHSLYITLPEDAVYRNKTYPTTGKAVQQELYSQFKLQVDKAETAFSVQTKEDYLKEAKNANIDLLVIPQITYWEDRVTSGSGKPDKTEVVVDIVDVKTEKNVNRAKISAEGPTMTFVNHHPDYLLGKAFVEYVQRLYDNL